LSEPELIARVLSGDRVAARELYDAHAPRVYRLAHRLTGEAEIAREITQDVFVRAFRQLSRFRAESALSTWLHRITVTVVADTMRARKTRSEREFALDDLPEIGREPDGIDPIVRERLHQAIDALPEHFRLTVIMHDFEGYTHTEIAQVLGVAEGTCKSRLSLARARLREALSDLMGEFKS